MNKYLKYLVCAVVSTLAFSVFACGKSNDNQIVKDQIIGTWKTVKKNGFKVYGDDVKYYRFSDDGMVYVLELDDDYGRISPSVEQKGYSLKGKKLYLRDADRDVDVFTIITVTEKELTLRDDDRDRIELIRVADAEIDRYLN